MASSQSNSRQALWLGISQASTFVVVFLSGAILSRYFPKADYGTYKQVMFVYTTLNVIFSAGLASVFPFFIPRYSLNEGKTIVTKVTWILVLLGALFSLFLFASAGLIAKLLGNPDLTYALRLFSPAPLFTLPALGVEGLYTALKKTQYVVFYQVGGKILHFCLCVLPVVLFHGTYKEAIIGWVAAAFFTFLIAMVMKNLPYRKCEAEPLPDFYKKVFGYSLPLMYASLVGIFLHSANQFFISRYCGQETFAEYSNGFLTLPIVGMIAGPIKSVLVPLFSKASKDGTMDSAVKSYESSFIHCVTLVFPFIFFCFLFSQDIMSYAFGRSYSVSGTYFRCSLINDVFDCLPYLAIILALGKTKAYFNAHLYAALMVWGIDFLLVGLSVKNPVLFAVIYVFFCGFTRFFMFHYIRTRLHVSLLTRDLLKRLAKILAHLFVLTLLIWGLHGILSLWIGDLLNLIICFIVFFALVVLSGRFIGEEYYVGALKRILQG